MSLFNLAPIVSLLSTHAISVARRTNTYDSNGRAANETTSTALTGRASVQPVSGETLEHERLSDNGSNVVEIYTSVALLARDRVTVTGLGTFQVQRAESWGESGSFTKAVAIELDPGEPRA